MSEALSKIGPMERLVAVFGLEKLRVVGTVAGAITGSVFDVLGVHNSVASRMSYGGTAPARVREQVARWKEVLG